MDFKKELPIWENEGVKPPKTTLTEGWKVGDKPPADWFNWFFNSTYINLQELREIIDKLDTDHADNLVQVKNELSSEIDDMGLLILSEKEEILKIVNDKNKDLDTRIKETNTRINSINADLTKQIKEIKDLVGDGNETIKVQIKKLEDDQSTMKLQISSINGDLRNKVDKIDGKGLSTNDYTTSDKAEVKKIKDKVDKVTGKGLSTNDYSDLDKVEVGKVRNKVDKESGKGLSTNDYTDSDKREVAKIKDKVDKIQGKGLSTNDYTTSEKSEVAKIKDKADKTELDKVFQSGVESNKILVDALNSKEVKASTSDTIKTNVTKVNDIQVGDYSIGDKITFDKLNEETRTYVSSRIEKVAKSSIHGVNATSDGNVIIGTSDGTFMMNSKLSSIIWENNIRSSESYELEEGGFILVYEGNSYHIDNNGKLIKQIDPVWGGKKGIVQIEKDIIVVTGDRDIVKYNYTTDTTIWKKEVVSGNYLRKGLYIYNGSYIFQSNDTLYSYDDKGNKEWELDYSGSTGPNLCVSGMYATTSISTSGGTKYKLVTVNLNTQKIITEIPIKLFPKKLTSSGLILGIGDSEEGYVYVITSTGGIHAQFTPYYTRVPASDLDITNDGQLILGYYSYPYDIVSTKMEYAQYKIIN